MPPDADRPRRRRARRGEVWLHLGLHKTGTTHVQHQLRTLRESLAADGVGTPDLGRHPGWPLIYWAAETPKAERHASDPSRAPLRTHAARAETAERVETLLADRSLPLVLLSAEQFSTQLAPRDVARLVRRLRRSGRRPRAVAYVRDPESFSAAMLQQVVLAGRPLADALARPPLLRCARRLRPWLRALGPENVTIRVHDRSRLVRGDAFADLLDAVGRPDLAHAVELEASPRNPRLSAAGLHLLDLRNRALGALAPGLARRRPGLVHLIAQALPGAPATLPPETLARIRRATADDRRWLARRLGADPFGPRG